MGTTGEPVYVLFPTVLTKIILRMGSKNHFQTVWSIGIVCVWAYRFFFLMAACFSDRQSRLAFKAVGNLVERNKRKRGFFSQRTVTIALAVMSVKWSSWNHGMMKDGNTSNMLKHLSTQHGLKLQECHVLDKCHCFPNEQWVCQWREILCGNISSTQKLSDFTVLVKSYFI